MAFVLHEFGGQLRGVGPVFTFGSLRLHKRGRLESPVLRRLVDVKEVLRFGDVVQSILKLPDDVVRVQIPMRASRVVTGLGGLFSHLFDSLTVADKPI